MARQFNARPQRMAKHWDTPGAITVDFTANATQASSGLLEDEAWTVIRMIGEYVITPTSAPAAGDQAVIAIGIAVVSADAGAAGAVPDPVSEPSYPWLYWADHRFHFSTTSADPNSAASSLRHRFDVRSMRKIKPREELIVVAEYIAITGAPPLSLVLGGPRVLVAR